MKIIVFGSTGETGRQVVIKGLEKGHYIKAFAMKPESLIIDHKNLTVIKGDVLNFDQVSSSLKGQDRVIISLGVTRESPIDVCSRGTEHILKAMVHENIKRVICITGAMIGHPPDKLVGWIYKFMRSFLPQSKRQELNDRQKQEKLINSSELNWLLVRPLRLASTKPTGHYKYGDDIREALKGKPTAWSCTEGIRHEFVLARNHVSTGVLDQVMHSQG